jgi:uncharacterized repeat protein (TIGR03803 family)
MTKKRILARLLLTVAPLALLAPSTFGQTENVIYNFEDPAPDGVMPKAGLIMDRSGNLYGTTSQGGEGGEGAVFQLVPDEGGWDYNLLDYFVCCDGGGLPAGLTLDEKGNVYGTTAVWGVYNYGNVFQLSPDSSGQQWTQINLYSFQYDDSGAIAYGGVVLSKGQLFGTTTQAGTQGFGTAFSLSPAAGGTWTLTVIHEFTENDANNPRAQLTVDGDGNLYGTSVNGGTFENGTVFQLKLGSDGQWNERLLHSFSGRDGAGPYGSVSLDHDGNVYGTTSTGGAYGYGTVFELIRDVSEKFTMKQIYNFTGGSDGGSPYDGVTLDGEGNLYGTTLIGGDPTCKCGTVFELNPGVSGWTESVLRDFVADGTDGYSPYGSVVLDSNGNIYGTTYYGGTFTWGIVFKITR